MNRLFGHIKGAKLMLGSEPIRVTTSREFIDRCARQIVDDQGLLYNQVQYHHKTNNVPHISESLYERKHDPVTKLRDDNLAEFCRKELMNKLAGEIVMIDKLEVLEQLHEEGMRQYCENVRPDHLIRVAPRTYMMLRIENYRICLTKDETKAVVVCFHRLKPSLLKVRRK